MSKGEHEDLMQLPPEKVREMQRALEDAKPLPKDDIIRQFPMNRRATEGEDTP